MCEHYSISAILAELKCWYNHANRQQLVRQLMQSSAGQAWTLAPDNHLLFRCCGLRKVVRKPNTQEVVANIHEGAAGLWSPAKADLGDEQATVLSVCQNAHQRKGGVGRKDEVATAMGGLQGSQREVFLRHAQTGMRMPALQDGCWIAALGQQPMPCAST